MAQQPVRMIATLNLGEPHWSMDTGGFRGNPTSEEYARWIEFAAFTPIFRVHARLDQKRQPWIFGPLAEAAATKAMRLRYSLLPYIYSAERKTSETGIGIVRPLEWVFPDDPVASTLSDEWMFGDALLVAPILDLKAKTREVYLPVGHWTEFETGKAFAGGTTIELDTDAKAWTDIPLFVREGSMLASEAPGDDTDAMHPEEITVDIFPSRTVTANWTMYDDDGKTYDYEKGLYFKQDLSAGFRGKSLVIDVKPPKGTYTTCVRSYMIRVHGVKANSLEWNKREVTKHGSLGSVGTSAPSWVEARDRFGARVDIRVNAGYAHHIELQGAVFNGK